VTVVLVAAAGADLARLAEGIAQRAWLAPRLEDWNQIAPHLALQSDKGVGLLLVAPRFDDRTRAAVEALGGTGVRLAELLPRGDLDVELRLVAGAEAPSPPRPNGPTSRLDGGFRSGLRD
jgi:hypothetical protein